MNHHPAGLLCVLSGLLAAALVGSVALAYNSDEHTLIADAGAAQVSIPAGVTLPDNIGLRPTTPEEYQKGFREALELALGADSASGYSKQSRAQDNCYWNQYGQRDYNLRIRVPGASEVPGQILHVLVNTGSQARTMTFGQMVALYGDYRRTTYCSTSGECFLTDADVDNVRFTGNIAMPGSYCPEPVNALIYLRRIANGLVPPFGTAGNTMANTARDDEYDEAGWWGDEMLRIADVNDWHFSNAAIAWYTGMHRLALIYASKAATDPRYWNQALHYEANALHSLTDLFAFGHVVTNRDQTSSAIIKKVSLDTSTPYSWMKNVLTVGGGERDTTGRVTLNANLGPITDAPSIRKDFMASYVGSQAVRANGERKYHDHFNESGATVRNLNGEVFVIYGDGKLQQMNANAKAQISEAVRTSLQSLFDAYVLMSERKVPIEDVGALGSRYFAALKYVPVYIESDKSDYFTGMWTLYAKAVNDITGAGKTLDRWEKCQIPYLSGGDTLWPRARTELCAQGPSRSN